jgi:hypothetical protein
VGDAEIQATSARQNASKDVYCRYLQEELTSVCTLATELVRRVCLMGAV